MKRFSVTVALVLVLGSVSTLALAQGTASMPPATATQKPAMPPEIQKPAPPAAPQSAPQPPKPFPEGSTLAYINVPRIAAESTEGKALNARAVALGDKRRAELNAKNTQLETARQKLGSGGLLSEDARLATQKEADKLQVEIQRMQQDAEAELAELQQQLQLDFQRKLSPVIQQMVTEKKLHILFSQTDAGAVWWDSSLDLTGEAIKRFDAAMAAAKPPAASNPKQ